MAKRGFVSNMDRVVLGAMTDAERQDIIRRERQRVISEVYASLRAKLEPLGININGSCHISEDGSLRYHHRSEADEPQMDDVLAALRDVAQHYSYASLAGLLGATHNTISAWVHGDWQPRPDRLSNIAQVLDGIRSQDPDIMAALEPPGPNRAR